MYGSTRISVVDRAVHAAARLARLGRLFVRLASRTRCGPTDLYAAACTAQFLAAHELIERAAVMAAEDAEIEIIHIRQPLWFGGRTLDEETR
ncbi:hypothetical protein ACQEVS_33005 [Streptomyces sp. CA-181903]|uniref:hypothetical protein n=1 Tax=Streptomyces sp. CA-181903 TaxID=3240055 RepID=UPI003D8DBAA7